MLALLLNILQLSSGNKLYTTQIDNVKHDFAEQTLHFQFFLPCLYVSC